VIRSFADKRTAAVFAGHSVRTLPNQIQGRARAKLLAVDAAKQLDDLRLRRAIGSKRCTAIGAGNAASALTINGGYASNGAKVRHGTSRSRTITEDEAMSIKREDLDAGRIDFSDVSTGKRLPLIHPGEILRDDFLQPMKISVYTLAQAIKVPRSRINDVVLGRRGITADTAFRLARYFGTTPDFWINLQARYDLDAADRKLRRRIEREVTPRAA
jgi:antitoxin HigA-1